MVKLLKLSTRLVKKVLRGASRSVGARRVKAYPLPIPSRNLRRYSSEPSTMAGREPLVWIDCEMTGLDPDNDVILEIFCIITTGTLEVVDDAGWGIVVRQSKERMDLMDEWCTTTHANSGLTASVLESTVSPEQAAEGLLAYITKHVPEKGTALLAGNSVHMDRAFLSKAPYSKVLEHLHYRILDVSSIMEAARRWSHRDVLRNSPEKQGLHQARADILDSIAQARYFKEAIFEKSALRYSRWLLVCLGVGVVWTVGWHRRG